MRDVANADPLLADRMHYLEDLSNRLCGSFGQLALAAQLGCPWIRS